MQETLTPKGSEQQPEMAADRDYQESVRRLADGLEISDSERDRILAAAGKTIDDLQTDIRVALGK